MTARQAPEPAAKDARAPGPVLPLVVVAVPSSEDDVELERDLLSRSLVPLEPVVERAWADVGRHEFAGVQDILAARRRLPLLSE